MKKIISILVFCLFLCGFDKANFKIISISQNSTKIFFYIPKDFCEFKLDSLSDFMSNILDNKEEKSYNSYYYRKCDVDEKELYYEMLEIIIPKNDVIPHFKKNKTAEVFLKNALKVDSENMKIIFNKTNKIDLLEEINKNNLDGFFAELVKLDFEETKIFYSNKTQNDYKILENNLITHSSFDLNSKIFQINRFSGFVRNLLVDIIFQSRGENNDLNNENEYATYINAIQELNSIPLNSYFQKTNSIINLKLPKDGNFYDVSHIKDLNIFFFDKMFISTANDDNDLSKPFIGVSFVKKNKSLEDLSTTMQEIFKKANIEIIDSGKFPFLKVRKNNTNILYLYPVKINNFYLLIISTIYHNTTNIDLKNEKKLAALVETYIKYLIKINKEYGR